MAKQETGDIDIPQPKARQINKAADRVTPMEVDVEPAFKIDNRIDKEWMANMAFAKELITIRVDESTDENAEKFVEVWNNGDYMRFPRGEEVTCERRFVETLMRAKPIRYSQKAVLDDMGKVGAYQEIPARALRYHFQVVRDDSPNSKAWLKSILSQF